MTILNCGQMQYVIIDNKSRQTMQYNIYYTIQYNITYNENKFKYIIQYTI